MLKADFITLSTVTESQTVHDFFFFLEKKCVVYYQLLESEIFLKI